METQEIIAVPAVHVQDRAVSKRRRSAGGDPAPRMADAPFLSLREIEKSYDGINLVVKRLCLDVRRGEFLTLLGPSGSGKTTLLMILAGFEQPTHGVIELAGRDLTRTPPFKRDIGMVFQNYALFPHMTVAENIAFPLIARRTAKIEIAARVARALGMIKLEGLGGRRPAQLSGGQQQRVALARALVYEPAIVLMDEPLGALDKQLREHMQVEIKNLHHELGLTVIYVTHDQDEALAMSDRVAVFSGGIVEQVDIPKRIYEEPQTRFVAGFVGENNLLTGMVVSAASAATPCRVRVGASEVLAMAAAPLDEGQAVTLVLRPERIVLAPYPGQVPQTHQATITDVSYFGDRVRLRCCLFGRDDFSVKIANLAALSGLAAGQQVALGWLPQDCRALSV